MKISAVLCSVLFLASCSSTSNNIKNSDALVRMPQGTIVTDLNQSTVPQTEFDKAQTKLEMSIIQQTPTPIWVPPVVTKVLIMPYVDKNDILHSYQYAFEQLTPGKWLMGKYLVNNNNKEQGEIQKPLEDNGVAGTSMQYPLSANEQQGAPQLNQSQSRQGQNSYSVPATKENIQKVYNNDSSGQNNNTGASFFEGGNPKNTIDTSIDSSDSGNRSQEYFNMKVNQMKSGQ
jgi:hypothetical protein